MNRLESFKLNIMNNIEDIYKIYKNYNKQKIWYNCFSPDKILEILIFFTVCNRRKAKRN